MENTLDYAKSLDSSDELASFRDKFHIPKNQQGQHKIYFCGNSLGLQPKNTKEDLHSLLNDWEKLGVDGHTEAEKPWVSYHEIVTDQLAAITGAKAHEVVAMNSLTVNLHLMMISFYRPTPSKYKILIEENTFPSDIYAVSSQLKLHGYDPAEAIIYLRSNQNGVFITKEDIDETFEQYGDQIALVLIGGVNYYSGQFYDMPYITEKAHAYGCMVGFDLAHGVGNILPNLHDTGADFAVWCSYKYLNAGPGSISGVFVHERHGDWEELPRLEGWWGTNKKDRFKMKSQFEPIFGAEGWQLSNPPVFAIAPLKSSLNLFEQAGMERLRQKSKLMSTFALLCLQDIPEGKVTILAHPNVESRGCQLSIKMKFPNKKLFNTLTNMDIVSDWREPDVIRIAPVPLYNQFEEIFYFVEKLKLALKTID